MAKNNDMNGNNIINNNNNMMINNQIFEEFLSQQGKILFDSNSNNISFIFSLNKKKLYYSKDYLEKSMAIPNFSIIYDNKRECFYGNENNIYMNMSGGQGEAGIGETSFPKSNFGSFTLSGQNEFNIKDLEVFEIILND